MSDHYVDPQSGILRNMFGLISQESLNRAEANAVSARSILLRLNPLRGAGHGTPNVLNIQGPQADASLCGLRGWNLNTGMTV
jgi:hypothetical protein